MKIFFVATISLALFVSSVVAKGRVRRSINQDGNNGQGEAGQLLRYYEGCVFYNPSDIPFTYDVARNTVVAANIVFRHGERNPSVFYPNDPHSAPANYPEGLGELTEKGKDTSRQIGAYIKHRYADLLSDEFADGDILMQTTDKKRAIDSAKLALDEMYPNTEIPLVTISAGVDNKLQFKANCTRYAEAHEKFMAKSRYIKWLYENKRKLMEDISTKAGWPENATTYNKIAELSDTIWMECQTGHNVSDWTNNWVYPWRMQPFLNLEFLTWTATPFLALLEAGPLIHEHVENFNLHLLNKSSYINEMQGITISKSKLYLYSAHSSTLVSLLNSLELYGELKEAIYSSATRFSLNEGLEPIPPLYASMYIFELHCRTFLCRETPTADHLRAIYPLATQSELLELLQKYYHVRVYLKPRKDEWHIVVVFPYCEEESWCTLAEFQELCYDLIIDNDSWQYECTNTN